MEKAIDQPLANKQPVGAIVVGAYAWIVAMLWGMVLLDVAYANNLQSSLATPQVLPVYSEIADFLLLIGSLALLIGIGAILLAWRTRGAGISLLASLFLSLLQFMVPAVLSAVGPAEGGWIRIIFSTAISLLAFVGFYLYVRRR